MDFVESIQLIKKAAKATAATKIIRCWGHHFCLSGDGFAWGVGAYPHVHLVNVHIRSG